jgi:hypothetical protein
MLECLGLYQSMELTCQAMEKWAEAMKKEISNFMSRGVWKKISRREVVNEIKRRLITCKWIFKEKVEHTVQ